MPTVRQIAEQAGVSISTVSLVLNNKPGVSDEMRRVVIDARDALQQQEMRRTTSEMARVDVGRTDTSFPMSIVVLHPPVLESSHVFREVLRGIQTAAQAYNLQLRLVSNAPNATEHHVSHLYFTDPSLRPDGVIVFGAQRHEPLLNMLFEQGIPGVVLGRKPDNYDISGIGRDEERHAYEATRYLTKLGHRAIAFIGGEQVYDYWHTRMGGYTQALHDASINISSDWIQPGDCEVATRRVLKSVPEVTALIYVNDACAAEGLPVLAAAGKRIPEDASVISFDDTHIAQSYDPPITSISYRRFEEGEWAIKMLIDQIQYPYLKRVQAIFDADFIVRKSCAPPPARD
ncbi:MAG: LacI family DNA-binding transcriptional regulator [Chloroflexota bacterium]